MEEEKVLKDFPDKQTIIDISEELESAREDTSDWIIYKVPNKLRKIRPAAYTPQLVSIGPFHHGKSNLKAMEHYKAKYMNEFLTRPFCKHIEEEDLMNELKKEDGKLVKRIQRSYKEETFEPENKKKYWTDPIPMILRDACFILELFLRNYENQLQPPDEEDKKKSQLNDKEIKDYACFIFKPFFRNHETQIQSKKVEKYRGDYILSPWVKAAIQEDLILLENQLPFFVLAQLFDFIFKHPSININDIPDYLPQPKNNEGDQVADFFILITREFFIDYYRFGKPCTKESSKKKPHFKYSKEKKDQLEKDMKHFKYFTDLYSKKEKDQLVKDMKHIKHFTDLVRKFICDETVEFRRTSEDVTTCLYSAKQLDNAGVMFGLPKDATYLASINTWPDVNDGQHKCCQRWNGRDRCWRNGRCCCWINGCCWFNCLELKIPQLKVQDNTECIFRNVMALEQFVHPTEPRVCNYIFLLDQLINTVEDVDLLVDKGIIENWLGTNKAVAAMVNKLCDQIVTPRFFYTAICHKLNKYHNQKLNVARSTLKRVYFKDIWTSSSTVVGLVFLVFSFFSTYSTIKNLFFV